MTAIAILAMLAILVGSTLSITGLSVVSSVDAQMTGDNATMSGNMTGGSTTGVICLEPVDQFRLKVISSKVEMVERPSSKVEMVEMRSTPTTMKVDELIANLRNNIL
jgi:ABC-type lipoprotein release transport system permease subunit